MASSANQDNAGATGTLALLIALGVSLGGALVYDRHHARETAVNACIERGMAAYDNIGSDPTTDGPGASDNEQTTRMVTDRCRKSARAY